MRSQWGRYDLPRYPNKLYWLVVFRHPSEKWWSSSVGMMTFPIYYGKIKIMFQTTNQIVVLWCSATPHDMPCELTAQCRPPFAPIVVVEGIVAAGVATGSAGVAAGVATGAGAGTGVMGDASRSKSSWGKHMTSTENLLTFYHVQFPGLKALNDFNWLKCRQSCNWMVKRWNYNGKI